MARLFIALELSDRQKDEVSALQQKLKNSMQEVRWVRREGVHLTLKFLGEIDAKRIEQVKAAMDEAAFSVDKFEVSFGCSGIFPSPRKARVFWLGVTDGEADVRKLAEKTDKALSGYGFEPEQRRFKPHLTIGRARGSVREESVEYFIRQGESFQTGTVKVESVVLFESKLTSQGAIHTPRYKDSL